MEGFPAVDATTDHNSGGGIIRYVIDFYLVFIRRCTVYLVFGLHMNAEIPPYSSKLYLKMRCMRWSVLPDKYFANVTISSDLLAPLCQYPLDRCQIRLDPFPSTEMCFADALSP
jgi:hypothetical protein